MVREAIHSALPAPRKKTERPRWKIGAAVEFEDAILEADRKAPRKQRHTAHRIWVRIQNELAGCNIAERTVHEYVHTRKKFPVECLGLRLHPGEQLRCRQDAFARGAIINSSEIAEVA